MNKNKIEKRKVLNLSLEIQKINIKELELLEDIYLVSPSNDLETVIHLKKTLLQIGLNYFKLGAFTQFVHHPKISYQEHLDILIQNYNRVSKTTSFEEYTLVSEMNKTAYVKSLPKKALDYQNKFNKDLFRIYSVGAQDIVKEYLGGNIDFLNDINDLRAILKVVYPDQVEEEPLEENPS